ncbi:MAG: rod shape-determining protein RodA, partial [bacterium]|nr:rod shape-determining protein RodA [bacterium]
VGSIDYHNLLDRLPLLFLLSLVTLVAVLILGDKIFGSRRWVPLFGGLRLQVSEFVKLVIVLLVARYLTELRTEQLQVRDLWKLGGLVLLPMLLVMRQPDLGTALTYASILVAGMFLAGLPARYWAALCLLGLVLLPVGWGLLKDYQKARLYTFVNPGRDPRGAGYQVIQSKIAVGSGGVWGQGVTRGSQTQYGFLPVSHTDFIFSAFGEEHGFVGVVVALGLYFLLLMQIVQNAQTAPDRAGMFICMGVAALLLFQVLVNVGMVVGRMPTTGLPLPLMSYGGSSTLSIFAMLGLVNNVRLQRFVN